MPEPVASMRDHAVLSLFIFLAFVGSSAYGREVVDATQAKVKLVEQPVRIVTLAPSLGELAADFCGEKLERIVGVSEYTDYPPALAKTASIGQYARFNLEKVVSLKPDLVLATLDGNPKDQVLHLRELGMPVVIVATATLKDVEGSMRLVGQALGAPDEGDRMAKRFATGLARIRATAAGRKESPRIFLQIGDDPLVTVGRGSFLQEALNAVGARNVYGEADAHYPRPSLEDVVHGDPDRILVLALGHDIKPFEAMAARWAAFPKLKAVSSGKVRVLQDDALLRPTLRLLEGLSLLEQAVYGAK